ncbi:abnormal spindle-like microcephaly-associated protein homolog [Saccostrea echinata]|uniref:abnormal spindle-like microcephaly-associated protein homolog n=1 Tax=Saccostrea echinata TaxID=191078 RepID=UPI002A7F9D9D|nr:abnormal spindle-like microcephaly-associated protein homolog [Saccostrea echinata]
MLEVKSEAVVKREARARSYEQQMFDWAKDLLWRIFAQEKKKFPKETAEAISQKVYEIVLNGPEPWIIEARQIQVKAVILLENVKRKFKEELIKRADLEEAQQTSKAKKTINCTTENFESLQREMSVQKDTVKLYCDQRPWRTRKQRKDYLRKQKAVVFLEQKYKAHQLARRHRTTFIQMKSSSIVMQQALKKQMEKRNQAAIILQSYWRCFKANQRDYNQKRQAIVKLQALFRMKIQRDFFLVKKMAACKIQKWFRNELQRDRVKTEYQRKRHSIVVLQSAARGWMARKQEKQRKFLIIRIQSVARKIINERKFQIWRKYTVLCQRRFRAKLHGRLIRRQYLTLTAAAVTIQSCYRGLQTRRLMLLEQESARRIQSWYKGRKQYILCTELRQSVLVCQKTYRSSKLSQSDRRNFLVLKGAVLAIQAFYKGYKTRCMYQRMEQAIVLLQAGSRGMLERRRIKGLVKEKAAIVLQKTWRTYKVKCWYKRIQSSNTVIQRAWRARKLRKDFLRKQTEAVSQQQKYKAHQLARRHRSTFIQVISSNEKQQARDKQMEKHIQAAATLQSYWRCFKSDQRDYNQKRQAIVKLQAFFRMKIQRDLFLVKKMAVCKIQKFFRNKIQRDRAKREYQRKRRSVIVLQSAARGWMARKQAKQRKIIIIQTQAAARKSLTDRKFHTLRKVSEFCKEIQQAKLHGRLIHQQCLALHKAAVIMQSCFTGQQSSRLMLLEQESARRIQSWYKGRKQYILYRELRQSILVCQRTYRASKLAQSDRRNFLVLKGAVLTIQAFYKGYKTRCMYQRMEQAIVLLQASSRGFLDRKRMKELHEAAAFIQQAFKNHWNIKLVKEKERQDFFLQFAKQVKIHLSATVLQRCYRTYKAQANKQLHSALIIQNLVRGRLCRIRFLKLKKSVLVIETAALKWKHTCLQKEKQAATLMQDTHLTMEEERQEQLLQFAKQVKIHLSATVLQRCYRKYKAHARKQLHSALIIQNWVRGRLCRIKFLKLKKSVLVIETATLKWKHVRLEKEKQAAIIMQDTNLTMVEEKVKEEEEKKKCKKLGRMKRLRRWFRKTFSCVGGKSTIHEF